jgi:hypothetical protein
MFRILILFLVFYIIYKFLKKIFFSGTRSYKNTPSSAAENIEGEKILPCENCKIYFPESQAVKHNGKLFCSNKCAKKYLTLTENK